MLAGLLPTDLGRPPVVLALGAHADDIEIGCGGTLLRLSREFPGLCVRWVVFSAHGDRADEADASARALLPEPTALQAEFLDFRDGFFPYRGGEVKDTFERIRAEVEPDLIFTHRREDLHQDHRLIGETTWQTFRDHAILEYEIPKYEGDLGSPNLLVTLSREIGSEKIAHLLRAFPSQRSRHWFDEETFWSLLRLRGVESGSQGRYAEGFTCRKLVV